MEVFKRFVAVVARVAFKRQLMLISKAILDALIASLRTASRLFDDVTMTARFVSRF